jgi:type VI secretion system protein ImpH
MQTTQRQRQPGLIGELFAEPWCFRFTSAVTLLLGWFRQRGMPHDEAVTQMLRFENSTSLGFPTAEVEALRAGEPADEGQVVVTPKCFGLLGTNGALPLHLTDRCAHAAAQGDAGARAWLDICSTRMVTLFWQAWAKNRIELAPLAEGRDTQREVMLALGGRHGADSEAAPWYAGLLRMRPVSSATLQKILAGELRLPVVVESLHGCWDAIAPALRSTLGATSPVLGRGVVLGTRQWRLDRRIRIVIGPLARADFERMLPHATGGQLLHELLVLTTAQALLEFEVCLLPDADCIPPLTLTARRAAMRRLGQDSVLLGQAAHRREIRYLLDPNTRKVPQ